MNALSAQGTLTRWARWVRLHRRLVIAGWVAAVAVAMAASHPAGTRYDNNLSLPGTESQRATDTDDDGGPFDPCVLAAAGAERRRQ